jgi:large subunit ribosomal protein L18
LKNLRVQFIKYSPKGDEVVASAISSELKNYGWNVNCSNTPSAYLVGLLAGKKAIKNGIREGVFDVGLQTPTKGGKSFAALKGVIDAGIEVPCEKKMLPPKERICGKHIDDKISPMVEMTIDAIKRS